MRRDAVQFSIARHASWAPGLVTDEAWRSWARSPFPLALSDEPLLKAMPPMLRRRAAVLGKMALEVAYACLGEDAGVPVVFCSRHGEVARAVELLSAMARGEALSPNSFSMAVHNAIPGLFSIARKEGASHIALAAGASTLEQGVIEACSLLADGAPSVLLVMADNALPAVFEPFADCAEQPHAFAWLLTAAGAAQLELSWIAAQQGVEADLPGSLSVLQFWHRGDARLERVADGRRWSWTRHV
jgi:Beta-ketoacyl synthase, N-terminal domain